MNEKNLPATTGEHQKVDKALALKFLDAMGLGTHLTAAQKEQFVEVAMCFNLNPFKREIHASVYQKWNPNTRQKEPVLSIITGYEVYLKRAERIGTLEGWHARTEGSVEKGDLKAIITIHKKGWKIPFEHEVDYIEYVQTREDRDSGKQVPNAMWGGKPKTMIKKVVTAQGFRLAFPDEMGGMPYTSDELPDNMVGEVRDVTPGKPAQPVGGFKRAEATGNVTDAVIVDGKPNAAAPATDKPAAGAAQPSEEELKAKADKAREQFHKDEPAKPAEQKPAPQQAADQQEDTLQEYRGDLSSVQKVKSMQAFRIYIGEMIFMTQDEKLAEACNNLKGKSVIGKYATINNTDILKAVEEIAY